MKTSDRLLSLLAEGPRSATEMATLLGVSRQAVSSHRSEARRMVARLDNFREVVLDFRGVQELGQAFADEVFRVFLRANPGVTLRVENLRPELRPMVRHVADLRTAERVLLDGQPISS